MIRKMNKINKKNKLYIDLLLKLLYNGNTKTL